MMTDIDRKKSFRARYPDLAFLEMEEQVLGSYLVSQDWLENGEAIRGIEKPGEGNMNFVVRVNTNQRTFILKQSRPFVEKYPEIEAPIERITTEAAFVSKLSQIAALKSFTPAILHFDETSFVLMMEDLGDGTDYSYLYKAGRTLSSDELTTLVGYLGALHQIPVEEMALSDNLAMRRLNHEHIFRFPFNADNGFDLEGIQTGLGALSLPFKTDMQLKTRITELGEIYLNLSEDRAPLHGDFYPGSWLMVPSGLKVIDPEFGFAGRPEFDMGVFLAHLTLTDHDQHLVQEVFKNYLQPAGYEESLMLGFAGTEILRRLIGVAQLPLVRSLQDKEMLMKRARSWILG